MEVIAPVVALVPAAGEGSRLQADDGRRKQFQLLGGEPVLVRTLEALATYPGLRQIAVAVPQGQVDEVRAGVAGRLDGVHIEVVVGGASRQESVAWALDVVSDDNILVAVHDGVRPFLPVDRLHAVIEAASRSDAAALAVPVVDTLRRVDGEHFGDTVDRRGLWRMQTPQVFRAGLLRRAIKEAGSRQATDEVDLVLQLGVSVTLVEGAAANIKITSPADWQLAQMLWPEWHARRTGK